MAQNFPFTVQHISYCLLLIPFLICDFPLSLSLTDEEALLLTRRQLHALNEDGHDLPDDYDQKVDVSFKFENTRLRKAYIALKALKSSIYSDPLGTTKNWDGPNVCEYNGIFCSPAIDDEKVTVVSGVDLNNKDIAGYLPVEIGLMTDLALFHINSNRFCGIIPNSFAKLKLLYELDLSNNRFVGPFPNVVLEMEELRYLDIRFNNFEGVLPPDLFNKHYDALLLNDNRFESNIPETIGNSTVSLLVLANNKFTGCIPNTIGNMAMVDEINFGGNKLGGCMPTEIGLIRNLTVLDLSRNSFVGTLPKSLSNLAKVESLDVSGNKFIGDIPNEICKLSSVSTIILSNNYFKSIGEACNPTMRQDVEIEDKENCLPNMPNQRSPEECLPMMTSSIECDKVKCGQPTSSTSNPPKQEGRKSRNNDDVQPSPPKQVPSKPLPPPIVEHKSPPPVVQSPPTPLYSPPPPPVYSPPPPVVQSPPPPSPNYSPPPPPVQSPPPPAPVPSPSPPVHSPPPPVFSPPPPVNSPPPPTPSPPLPPSHADVNLPPNLGFQYKSPPPPMFPGY